MGEIDLNAAFVIMGVCGVGKTSIGQALSVSLPATYIEADTYHPPENIAAMSAGIPLSDAMRIPWLESIGEAAEYARAKGHVVVACSALKRSYRDLLQSRIGCVKFVYLHGERDLIADRLKQRSDHFMPTTLLDSQIETLEPPTPEEHALFVDITGSKDQVQNDVENAVRAYLATSNETIR
ncbi:hypothetical protein RC74_13480 [Falsihalocynthiibacter arcticus]|uniref:Gluconokinase n=1 Tax=Falsihalocynthiibacter arcticus TaxID=1579316 RepID=A0A126V1I8_9RHOB|nr:hypothetical protein RC74_13480 [Falsihalocynthiibacter arcticus]